MAASATLRVPAAPALRAEGDARVLPVTDVFVLVLGRLELIGLELIGLIRRLRQEPGG
ncbi:MAG: hypothetical protein M3N29_06760 [Chloroflexota bacterium]|nr:hypothetical protein [Chloroflexota bacterium]